MGTVGCTARRAPFQIYSTDSSLIYGITGSFSMQHPPNLADCTAIDETESLISLFATRPLSRDDVQPVTSLDTYRISVSHKLWQPDDLFWTHQNPLQSATLCKLEVWRSICL